MKQADRRIVEAPKPAGRPPRSGTAHPMVELQRLAGNRAVTALLQGPLPVQRLRRLPSYQDVLQLRQQLTGQQTVSGLAIEKKAVNELGLLKKSLAGGYRAGRHGVNVSRRDGRGQVQTGGLGMLLSGMGKGAMKEPGRALKSSHRMAGFFGAMSLGMMGRAAAYVPEKVAEWRRAGATNVVNFGPEQEEDREDQETAHPVAGNGEQEQGEEQDEQDEGGGAIAF